MLCELRASVRSCGLRVVVTKNRVAILRPQIRVERRLPVPYSFEFCATRLEFRIRLVVQLPADGGSEQSLLMQLCARGILSLHQSPRCDKVASCDLSSLLRR